jgi:hypoxanthine phosphoribosyltransferase
MKNQKVHDKNFEIYIEKRVIKERVLKLSEEVYQAMKGRIPHFIAVLDGAFVFASDLLRAYPSPCKISFVKLSSYQGLSSSGEVHELIGLKEVPENECLIVLEDIVDTGATLTKIEEILKKKEWYIATLFFKPKAYNGYRHIDFVGFQIPNDFVVGYGLDYNGFGRNLKNVYKLVKA